MTSLSEGQLIAEAKAAKVAALTWEELDAYGERVENVVAVSGRTYRVKSFAFWDMDEWASGVNIQVKAYPPSGFRRFWRYKAWRTRGGPDDLVPQRPRS